MTDRPPPIHPADDESRDPHLDALWRALPVQKPPLEIDVALRAAARREVGAGPQISRPAVAEATRPERWWWPLAAAATIGAVAIGILQLVNEPSNERDAMSDMARAPASRADAAKSAVVSAPTGGRETDARVQTQAVQPRDTGATAKAEAPPVPEQAPAKPAQRIEKKEKNARAALDARTAAVPANKDVARQNAPIDQALSKSSGNMGASSSSPVLEEATPLRANAPAAAAAQSTPLAKVGALRDRSERAASERATRPVAEWIALIRRLRDEGATGDASRELVAFREAHPDAERLLPPDLRDWRPPKP